MHQLCTFCDNHTFMWCTNTQLTTNSIEGSASAFIAARDIDVETSKLLRDANVTVKTGLKGVIAIS